MKQQSGTLITALLAGLVLALTTMSGLGAGNQGSNPQSPPDLQAVFSADGTKLASLTPDGRIMVVDLRSGQELIALESGPGVVSDLVFSPDAQVLAIASENAITLWDLTETSEPATLLEEPNSTVNRLAFSPRGDAVAAILDDARIAIWELQNQHRSKGKTKKSLLLPQSQSVEEIVFSPDGSLLASYGTGAEIIVWDLASQRESRTFSSPTGGSITGIAYDPAGATLAAADEHSNIILWEIDSGSETVLGAHTDLIKRLRFSPEGSLLASEAADANLFLWDVNTGRLNSEFPAREDTVVTGLAFSPDGAKLASVGDFSDILIWSLASGELNEVLAGHVGRVVDLTFDDSSQSLASIDTDGQLIVWDLDRATQRLALEIPMANTAAGNAPVDSVAATPVPSADNQPIALSTAPTATSADAASKPQASQSAAAPGKAAASTGTTPVGRPVKLANKPENRIKTLAVSPNGSKVAVVGGRGLRRFNEGNNSNFTEQPAEALTETSSVAFDATGANLYTVGQDTEIRRWNAETGKLTQVLQGHEHPIRAVAVSRNNRFIATAGEETRILVWSAAGKLLRIFSAHRDFVNALAFRPKALQLASASNDGKILIWNPNANQPVAAFLGHSGPVEVLAYSKDGKVLASGGADATVRVWNANNGRQLASFVQASSVSAVAISGNNRYLASAEGRKVLIRDLKNTES